MVYPCPRSDGIRRDGLTLRKRVCGKAKQVGSTNCSEWHIIESMQIPSVFGDEALESIPPSGEIYYHYTSRELAQEISISGLILPSSNGLVYLTDVLYTIGWQATDRLALPNTKAEVAIPVRIERGAVLVGAVPPWAPSQGSIFRRGGGRQWVVNYPVPVDPYPWTWMELEAP